MYNKLQSGLTDQQLRDMHQDMRILSADEMSRRASREARNLFYLGIPAFALYLVYSLFKRTEDATPIDD